MQKREFRPFRIFIFIYVISFGLNPVFIGKVEKIYTEHTYFRKLKMSFDEYFFLLLETTQWAIWWGKKMVVVVVVVCDIFLVCSILDVWCWPALASCHSCWYLGYMSSPPSPSLTTTTKVSPEPDNKNCRHSMKIN